MFSYAFKAILFCSLLQLVVAALALSPRNNVDFNPITEAVLARRFGGPPPVYAAGSASVNAQVMVQGWSTLTSSANECHSVFQQKVSMDVAIQAAVKFTSQVNQVNNMYSRCACEDPSAAQAAAQFQATITQFFVSFQAILQSGQQQYGREWGSRFAPEFQKCAPAFASLKTISGSLRVDLAAIISKAHIDVNLFVKVGLNLNGLLGLSIGIKLGGLHL